METLTFPPDTIDPWQKNAAWILKFTKAAYSTSKNSFQGQMWFGRDHLSDIRSYGLGQQSIEKLKKLKNGDEQSDDTWENLDYSVVDYLSKYRNIAIAKICQRSYDIQCSAVDPLSRSEEDKKFNEMKVKMEMREMATQAGSELADSPALRPAPGEPEDEEQLKMEQEFGYKHVLAMEAEMGIQLVHEQNNFEAERYKAIEDKVDWGVGGYTNWIDHNGNVRTRRIDIRNLVISPCRQKDFSDLTYWGEVLEVYVGDLAPYFNRSELIKICESCKGKNGNPLHVDQRAVDFSGFKVYVLDFKFLSYDTVAHEERVDSSGNMRFGKTDFKNLSKEKLDNYLDGVTAEAEEGGPKYYGVTRQMVYKTKWIIDTEFQYEYGISENMVRKPSSWAKTQLDIQLFAWNFDNGRFSGLTEKLIPFENQACLIWYKMQNLAAKLIPYIMNIDMTALEGVAYGKGGLENDPKNITEFIFSNYIALTRSKNLTQGNSQPLKPVTIETSGQLYAFGELRNQLLMVIEQMRQISGLNELTDASTPAERTVASGYQMAEMGTNNALYAIQFADRQLMMANADNIVMKLQIAVKLGKVEGYVRAMGQETLKFMQINPDIALREFGIFAQVMPSQQEREMILQDVTLKESQGLLDPTDKQLIMSCKNIKQCMMQLAYRIKKRKEQAQQFELQKIQENTQGQQQTMAMAEQLKQQTIQLQLQADIIRIQTEKEWDYRIQAMSKQVDYNAQAVQAEARNIGHQIDGAAKITATHIAAEASKVKAAAKPPKK